MRIQFEINELLADIVAEIFHSDKWVTIEKEMNDVLKRIMIKDPYYDSSASVDIWEHEIHITTAWSNYSYRIYQKDKSVWCEYIGAYRGLLEQKLLPKLTPKENFLNSDVLSSSLIRKEKETLRNYSLENVKNRQFRTEQGRSEQERDKLSNDHPKVVYDEFIKIGVPLPPPRKK